MKGFRTSCSFSSPELSLSQGSSHHPGLQRCRSNPDRIARPKMAVRGRVDELRGDPDPGSRLPHASFEDVAHAQAFPDLADVDVPALERERRIAGDDE